MRHDGFPSSKSAGLTSEHEEKQRTSSDGDLMPLYRVHVSDPPWQFDDNLPGEGIRGASKKYPTMTLDEIKAFPQPRMQADSLLLLWRVSAMVEQAYEVARAWGFEPKSEIVWVKRTDPVSGQSKPAFGMGHYTRLMHESCIIATRGAPKVADRSLRSVFEAPLGEHSAKPDEFYQLVQQLSFGPFVETFARKERRGWVQYGHEMAEAHP